MLKNIIIDPGHAISTAGKRFTFTDPVLHIREYQVVREVARYLALLLIQHNGLKVYDSTTRNKIISTGYKFGVYDDSLRERVNFANLFNPSETLFFSLHTNAVGDVEVGKGYSANGAEFYSSVGTSMSDTIAEAMAMEYNSIPGKPFHVRGEKDKNYFVLSETKCVAVLAELGFHTNLSDAQKLLSPYYQKLIAKSLYKALLGFIDAN